MINKLMIGLSNFLFHSSSGIPLILYSCLLNRMDPCRKIKISYPKVQEGEIWLSSSSERGGFLGLLLDMEEKTWKLYDSLNQANIFKLDQFDGEVDPRSLFYAHKNEELYSIFLNTVSDDTVSPTMLDFNL